MLLLAGPAAAHRVHPAISTSTSSWSQSVGPSHIQTYPAFSAAVAGPYLSLAEEEPAICDWCQLSPSCLDDCQYVSMHHRLLQEQVPALELPTKCRKIFKIFRGAPPPF